MQQGWRRGIPTEGAPARIHKNFECDSDVRGGFIRRGGLRLD